MQITPVLFERKAESGIKYLFPRVVPDATWVLTGAGVATVKYDGRPILMRRSEIFTRFVLQAAEGPSQGYRFPEPPSDWFEASPPAVAVGRWPGWVPIRLTDPAHELLTPLRGGLSDGTYELVGPEVVGNPYGLSQALLFKHASAVIPDFPRGFLEIHDRLRREPGMEGVVWLHPDGRSAKIRRKDFGLDWPQGVRHSHLRRPTSAY